ncbi:hypothetical protein ABGV42_00035 [Paenibacillus pabuli]|uniref:hypothetical protein n=1 Tax=Paenibacillus pabuli TaxID=1472 RepID=UPI0032420FF3
MFILLFVLIFLFGLARYLKRRMGKRQGKFMYHMAGIIFVSICIGYLIGDTFGFTGNNQSSANTAQNSTPPKINSSSNTSGAFPVYSINYVRSNKGMYEVSLTYRYGSDLEPFKGTITAVSIKGSRSYIRFPGDKPLNYIDESTPEIILYLASS